jgi:hypothetical protein
MSNVSKQISDAKTMTGTMTTLVDRSTIKRVTVTRLDDGQWEMEFEYGLDANKKAFMRSFKEQFNQYDVSDQQITDFLLCYYDEYFDGYSELADAYNLWSDAVRFAQTIKV